jgi:hypothetical protein
MLDRFYRSMESHPLAWITVLAAIPRVFAAIFSQGYYAHDDHFLMIEAAQSWVDGYDYNYWLPWNQAGVPTPTGHMMVYPGIHFLFFSLCKWVGFTDIDGKMIAVRLLHALLSLVTVRVGYKIAKHLAGDAIAWRAGLFLALFFFMPFLSVRNLVEVVSMPLLMLSAWWLLRATTASRPAPAPAPPSRLRRDLRPASPAEAPRAGAALASPAEAPRVGAAPYLLLLAGLFAGLAINIRFQTLFFPAGAGLALLLQRNVKGALLFGFGVVLPVTVLQGGIDLMVWGRPFAEMTQYVFYNLDNPTNTGITVPWYNYVLILSLLFVPPLSLAVMFGFLRKPRPFALWLALVMFLLFHSLFPNKQERFVLPVVPLFFVLGYCAWEQWREGSPWWQRHTGLWKGAMAFTWSLNLLLLLPLSVSSSKLERVQAMRVLRQHPEIKGVIIEDTVEGDAPMAPLYYWGKWGVPNDPYTDPSVDLAQLAGVHTLGLHSNAIAFVGDEDLGRRIFHATQALGPLEFIGMGRPGFLDRTLHWLNPMNRNAVILIYRIRP